MYSENPSGNSMNTRDRRQVRCDEQAAGPGASARGTGAFVRRGVYRAGARGVDRRHGLRSTSSTACDSPVSDVAGRDPRRTGPKLRSIRATIFSHAGVTGRPSRIGRPLGEYGEVADPLVGLGESVRVERGPQHRHEKAGFSDQSPARRGRSRTSRIPTPVPCVGCSPRWPVRWYRYWSGRAAPSAAPALPATG